MVAVVCFEAISPGPSTEYDTCSSENQEQEQGTSLPSAQEDVSQSSIWFGSSLSFRDPSEPVPRSS
jgi:hypothetical protein